MTLILSFLPSSKRRLTSERSLRIEFGRVGEFHALAIFSTLGSFFSFLLLFEHENLFIDPSFSFARADKEKSFPSRSRLWLRFGSFFVCVFVWVRGSIKLGLLRTAAASYSTSYFCLMIKTLLFSGVLLRRLSPTTRWWWLLWWCCVVEKKLSATDAKSN